MAGVSAAPLPPWVELLMTPPAGPNPPWQGGQDPAAQLPGSQGAPHQQGPVPPLGRVQGRWPADPRYPGLDPALVGAGPGRLGAASAFPPGAFAPGAFPPGAFAPGASAPGAFPPGSQAGDLGRGRQPPHGGLRAAVAGLDASLREQAAQEPSDRDLTSLHYVHSFSQSGPKGPGTSQASPPPTLGGNSSSGLGNALPGSDAGGEHLSESGAPMSGMTGQLRGHEGSPRASDAARHLADPASAASHRLSGLNVSRSGRSTHPGIVGMGAPRQPPQELSAGSPGGFAGAPRAPPSPSRAAPAPPGRLGNTPGTGGLAPSVDAPAGGASIESVLRLLSQPAGGVAETDLQAAAEGPARDLAQRLAGLDTGRQGG